MNHMKGYDVKEHYIRRTEKLCLSRIILKFYQIEDLINYMLNYECSCSYVISLSCITTKLSLTVILLRSLSIRFIFYRIFRRYRHGKLADVLFNSWVFERKQNFWYEKKETARSI